MLRIRTFMLFAAVIALTAFGANAQAIEVNPQVHAANLASRIPPSPDAAIHLIQGLLSIGVPLLDSSGTDVWPCFTGGSQPDCSRFPAGGLIVAVPAVADIPASCSGCAQIYWTFETDAASAPSEVAVVVKQGSNTVYSAVGSIGTITPGVWAVWVDGVIFTGAVPGPATINVLDVVGNAKARATANIVLR